MYQIGDKVCYGTEGVCSIVRIQEMKVGGAKGKYYVLRPIYRESATVYVPLDNERLIARMRPVLSQQELEALLVGADDAPLAWIDDPTERKDRFSRLLSDGSSADLLSVTCLLWRKRRQLYAAGRRMRSSDEQLLRDAEKLLTDEVALALALPRQEVPAYLHKRLTQPEAADQQLP